MSEASYPRIVAIANQKGGVGKTTTAINLAAALAETGKRVLIVDMDPQGNASTGLGIESNPAHGASDLLIGSRDLVSVIRDAEEDNLFVVPATMGLSSADMDFADNAEERPTLLRTALRVPELKRFGHVLIDCPPSLNILTINALVAADSVLVPLQAEFYALQGLSQLMETLYRVRDTANPELRTDGIVLTMFDSRNNLCTSVEGEARKHMGELVFETRIPRNVRLSEAPSHNRSTLRYDPASKGARAYRSLAAEFAERDAAAQRRETGTNGD